MTQERSARSHPLYENHISIDLTLTLLGLGLLKIRPAIHSILCCMKIQKKVA